ncbi:hypothetical protein ON010_g15401 [Phytophthora cinnamomi]|nr:hypothetical protein ON010_g15401 [Phytophthora cinnamomi]
MIFPLPKHSQEVLQRASLATVCLCLRFWRLKLSQVWSNLHISYRGGQYSVERLLALDEYTRTASLFRVLFTITALFLPLEVFIICQESVPLQDPVLGWRGNYGFWIRATIVSGAVFYTIMVQAKYFLKSFIISRSQQLLLISCGTAVQMVATMAVAAYVWFPIPFMPLTMIPVLYGVSIAASFLITGVSVIRAVLADRERLVCFGGFIATQQITTLIYPAYQVLFHAVNNTNYELLVIFLLPVIKLVIKNLALRFVVHMEDMMPEAVIFTVDFYNAVYMATSMENTNSTLSVFIIVLVDIARSATMLYCFYRRTATTMARLSEAAKVMGIVGNVLGGASRLCKHEGSFKMQSRQRIQIRSCLSHNISLELRGLLDQLERLSRIESSRKYSAYVNRVEVSELTIFAKAGLVDKPATWVDRYNLNVIFPAPTYDSRSKTDSKRQSRSQFDSKSATPHVNILREALEVLFTTECLILSTVIDAFVPLCYGIYLLVLVHLQSAKYHTELAGATTATIGDVVGPIFVFSLVESIALVLLVALIYRNLGFSALHHLAFVLETQRELFQSKLVACSTMVLALRVVHFGT